ncbi:heavy metal sensor histidine kinase [Hydrogenophaga sp.]|uniref:heavy metal sensor histidine kinase n=1 Tax=Hydrogenophaga sp. TaxID=1904254 RepID=UPI0025C12CDA|nr:heavy metal sensor histidine kinase [Hydrogenophaga sp.]
MNAATATRVPCTYSIGRRLSLLLATQTVIGLGLLLATIYGITSMLFQAKHEEQMQGYTLVLKDMMHSASERAGTFEMLDKLAWSAERRPGTFLVVSRADGSEFYRDPPVNFDVDSKTAQASSFLVTDKSTGDIYTGRLVLDCSQDAKTRQRLALLLVVATLAGGIFVAWATFWRVRCSLRPLLDLANQTRGIDVGQAKQRLTLDEPAEELQPLIEQFNSLMERVDRTYAQLEGFNADVAHELRTPLANLIGQTELALSRERSNADLEDTLHSNLEELQRMAGIINDMLFLAQADRGVKARRGEPVSLADLVRQVVEFHEAPMAEAGLSITIEGDRRLPVDEALIKRAVSNLLGNAIRYAEPGSQLCVRIGSEADGSARLWVENVGPSIEPEYLPRLFDRFFRADASRCEVIKPHHGLGLSIVAAIARMHDGFALAESAEGRTRVGFSVLGSASA